MPYLSIVLTVVFFYYRAAEFENEPGILWCVGFDFGSDFAFLQMGLAGTFAGQVGLFFGITIFRAFRKS
jgi:hypothetical protein